MTGLLNDLIEEEDAICETVFNSNSIPNIEMPDFLKRLHKYTKFSAECLIIAIIYIDRYNLN
jgi:Cyclin